MPAPTRQEIRAFVVTVTPDVVLYGTGYTGREYSVVVNARDRDEAIRSERRVRRNEDGRHCGVRYTYRARLATIADTGIDGFNPEFLGAKPARAGLDY